MKHECVTSGGIMNIEKLEKLEIKPKFNLKYCNNDERYSDGNIEDTIVDLLIEDNSEHYSDIIANNFNWPVYYHLTSVRKNLLSWYPFDKKKDVLEIGCGFGSITNMLCEKCNSVTAVELTKRRALGTLARCRDKENLEIIVGNLNDVEFEKKFDYITLIGVLEYQGTFTESDNPYVDFVKKIRTLLKPDGKLLIAIENKYGLKYWCGACEDHTGVPFDGINQYKIGNKVAETFSKSALEKIIQDAGFVKKHFYYPYPDYKLPTVIISENEKFEKNKLSGAELYYVPSDESIVAFEKDLHNDLIDNDVMPFFANSFLVECGNEASELGEVKYALLNNLRKADLNVGTKFLSNGTVVKWNNESKNSEHLMECLENMNYLKQRGIKTVDVSMVNNELVSPRIEATTMEAEILEAYKNKDIEKIIELLHQVYHQICKSSAEVLEEENVLLQIFVNDDLSGKDFGPILEKGMIDMIPRNAFCIEDEMYWFDQEWEFDNIPAKYILFRGIMSLYQSNPWINEVVDRTVIFSRCDMGDLYQIFCELEAIIIDNLFDRQTVEIEKTIHSGDVSKIYKNAMNLANPKKYESESEIKLENNINQILASGMICDVVDTFLRFDINNINSFKLKLFVRWLQNHKEQIVERSIYIPKSIDELVDNVMNNI